MWKIEARNLHRVTIGNLHEERNYGADDQVREQRQGSVVRTQVPAQGDGYAHSIQCQ